MRNTIQLFYCCKDGCDMVLDSILLGDFSAFGLHSSGYQNSMEFLTAIIGIHVVLNPHVKAIELQGDSISALSWAALMVYLLPDWASSWFTCCSNMGSMCLQ